MMGGGWWVVVIVVVTQDHNNGHEPIGPAWNYAVRRGFPEGRICVGLCICDKLRAPSLLRPGLGREAHRYQMTKRGGTLPCAGIAPRSPSRTKPPLRCLGCGWLSLPRLPQRHRNRILARWPGTVADCTTTSSQDRILRVPVSILPSSIPPTPKCMLSAQSRHVHNRAPQVP